ncbi:ATP-dependent nuclease [Hydrogenophaga sp.]|uniref:ATP-dependent nuclease n=1 Tax=Hydrogenophaga sp. TaxID=1904254 RepID=UPI003F6E7074
MADANRSKLVRLSVRNVGCIGNDGLAIELDNIVCLVGRNNSGKSTILRAYELARGSAAFERTRDRHQHAADEHPSEIELEVHIPEGIGNVDARWKHPRDGLLIVKSRWQWAAPDFIKVRETWDPKAGPDGVGQWADDKAGGADAVFSSRLPRPLRIGSLEDIGKTEGNLLTLALAPLLATLEKARGDAGSPLFKSINSVSAEIELLSGNHTDHFNTVSAKVTSGFQKVFPKLDVKLEFGAAPLVPNIADLVRSGSGLKIKDGKTDSSLGQQGTGARRALFWAMLQVHNELTRDKEIREEYRRRLGVEIADLEKQKKPKKGKALTTDEVDAIEAEIGVAKAKLLAHDEGGAIPASTDDPALPGYLLLIDEPENALHPMAARAAQRHLYKLAESPDWQVIMTTHSPYFINPFEDHTTIIRLERKSEDMADSIAPRTYRSDDIKFEGDDKARLQALQHIDPSFAEVFFGSYPILVEGDTEHAAFIAAIVEKEDELLDRVTVVRARGKAILLPLIKVLTHFKIDFGVVHDCDPPFTKKNAKNGMWTENGKIRDAVRTARSRGLEARHRVSIPDFERFLGGDEESKDKPLNAYMRVTSESELRERVHALLDELMRSTQHEPFDAGVLKEGAEYMDVLMESIQKWAAANGVSNDPRFKIS